MGMHALKLRDGTVNAVGYALASIGVKIKAKRMRLGVSQARLAMAAGVRVETLNRIERGTANPTVSTLQKIIRGLSR